jgi:hypothetical protein
MKRGAIAMDTTKDEKEIQTLSNIDDDISTDLVPIPNKKKMTDKPKINPMNSVLVDFLRDIQSIQKTRLVVFPHVLSWLKSQQEGNAKKLAKYASQREDEINTYRAESAHQAAEMLRAIRALDGLGGKRIPETLQRSLFTQLFSEYDAFVGALLKAIYKEKTDLLKGISRQISFADLLDYDNLNAIKLDMLEKEVETFRRASYVEQFASLEAKFGLKLRSFPEWGEFVELSQRRNLIVHNGGVVSDQYLLVCDREGYKFQDRPKLGDQLKLSGDYFSRATIVVSKVAFMLCHTLWRKLFPCDREIAHQEANSVLFDLLRDGRWNTANAIAKFTLTGPMKEGISDMDLRIRTINTAIATKFSGDKNGCKTTLESLDWSAALRDFRLAIAVLSDDFPAAAELMISIGKRGELVNELAYHEWPLFHAFRESPDFLSAYSTVYGISFIKEALRHQAEAVQSTQAAFDKGLEAIDIQPKVVAATGSNEIATVKSAPAKRRTNVKKPKGVDATATVKKPTRRKAIGIV